MENNLAKIRDPRSTAISEEDKIAHLQLIRSQNVGPITYHELLNRFGTAQDALEQIPHLARKGGAKSALTPCSKQQALWEIEAVHKYGAQLIFQFEPDYPKPLLEIHDTPPVLTVKGNASVLNKPTIAIVGSRNASLNGKNFASKIARELGDSNYIVASGLARGIDTHAHEGSLESGTIAVVAGGINVVFPPENQSLYDQIQEMGCIIAESPFGVEPQSTLFPKRNRLISGISQGVIVVEAAQKSGSLITARYALEQNREVFAVPGSPFDPRCHGTNNLIRQGATLIQKTEDIIESLKPPQEFFAREASPSRYTNFSTDSPSEKERDEIRDNLLTNMSYTPISIDELVRQCHVSPSVVLYVLLELELAGRVQRHPGNKIALVGN